MLDDATARILDAYLDDEDPDPNMPYDPTIHPETLWTLVQRRMHEGIFGAPDDGPPPVSPIEALAAARLLADSLTGSYVWMVADAREAGDSWAKIGAALDMARQSAWELYQREAPKIKDADLRERYLRLAGDLDDEQGDDRA